MTYHRDVYAGMIAGNLEKAGAFGAECFVCGFLSLGEDGVKFNHFSDEERCAQSYLHNIGQGKLVSPCLNSYQRINNDEELPYVQEMLVKALSVGLYEKYELVLYAANAAVCKNVDKGLAKEIEIYFQSLSNLQRKDKRESLIDLLGQCFQQKRISRQEYERLQKFIPVAEEMQDIQVSFYGFVSLNEEKQWEIYSNGYLPNVVNKREMIRQTNICVSGIVQKHSSASVDFLFVREECEQEMLNVFDATLLNLLQRLSVETC